MIRQVGLASCLPILAFALAPLATPQARILSQGPHRMEILLERLQGETWRTIDPGLVLDQGDRVRFRFHTNFDGYLYVMNQGSSGKYDQLFPRRETGEDNRILNGNEYQVPATSWAFTIAGPAGYETVYWLVSPARLSGGVPPRPAKPLRLSPRCDDAILHARGDCIDSSAGPRMIPRGEQVPQNIGQAAPRDRPDLLFMRQDKAAVVSSPEPLTGPVVYEFRLAHR